jgi:hypothetical protein
LLRSGLLPSLFILHARRNLVVAPGRALRISSLVSLVLILLAMEIVVPRVDILVAQMLFSVVDIVY